MRIIKEGLKITGFHLMISLISVILGFPFWYLVKHPYIFSTIFTLVYISVIYTLGWDMGKRDSRRVGEFQPNLKRAIKTALFAQIISVALFAFRVICPFIFEKVWTAAGAGFELRLIDHPVTTVADLLYKLWFYPCFGFMGNGSFTGYLLPLFIIPVVIPIAYSMGVKKIAWFDKFYNKIMYKK